MEMYYIDENGKQQTLGKKEDGKLTADSLRDKVRHMAIMADVEIHSPYRATVRVNKDAGTTMYLAEGDNDSNWLKFHSIKQEILGNITKYYFIFD